MIITNITMTAYCICKLCCGSSASGRTAAGVIPRAGVTIAAPRNLPFGTRVVIGNHTYIVQDRLAKRYDNRIDIFMSSHKAARQFGIRTNTVTIYSVKIKS